MPITLPQLSRRAFLKRAALAGAAAVVARPGYAGLFGKSRDPHTFAFFSDTHIAGDAKATHSDVNMANNLSGCVQQLAEWRVKPGAIIINGDLALTLGRPDDYKTFGNLVHPLRALAPIHLSLGNHDERRNFWKAFPDDMAVQASVPDKQSSVFSTARANWFLLDSLDITAVTPGHLGEAQLKWLARGLAARTDKPAIVVCHHPIDVTGLLGLRDSADLEEILIQHRQVKAFVFGHTHNWNITEHPSGVHFINLPQTAYPFQAGRPSGWVRATLAKDGAEFELRCLDAHHPEHGLVQKLKWRTS